MPLTLNARQVEVGGRKWEAEAYLAQIGTVKRRLAKDKVILSIGTMVAEYHEIQDKSASFLIER